MFKNHFPILIALFSLQAFSQEFPATKKSPSTITKHGISYNDDYRWLENMNSEEVNKWVDDQNAVAKKQLETVKKSYNAAFKIRDYDYLSSNPLPTKRGKYYYSRYRRDKAMPASLFYRKALNDEPLLVLNPYSIYKNKDASLFNFYPSKNSIYIAGEFNASGSDSREIRFSEMRTMKLAGDVLTNVKSNVAWNKDTGVFYKRNSNKNTFERDSTYQLFYHRLGTSQDEDKLVMDFSISESFSRFYTTENSLVVIETTNDERYCTLYECGLGNEKFELEKILEYETSDFRNVRYKNGRIYYSSNDFDWGDIRSFNPKNRQDEKTLIPQMYMKLLVSYDFYDDYIICKYKGLGKYSMMIYDLDGNFVRKFDAPDGTDFYINFYNSETKDLFVSFYSYTIPYQNFRLNLGTGEVRSYYNDYIEPKVLLFPLDYFVTKTVTFKSRDNVQVPITIIHKKGIQLDGKNPTLLKAYGGFGVVSGPDYDTGLLYFLEKGGVFAFAEIRGGGEKGLNWHIDGAGRKKINGFNDFIDAAEFLISEKYTSPQKLGITGGSHGGLVVGVAMTQRPELFKVAIPDVGVFDMPRFDEYSIGKYHYDEFGNPANVQDYKSILSYSPLQNIKEDVDYPTTLIITSENDDRVPPVHSYKFAAALQNRTAQKNPVFLQTRRKAGHHGKRNYADRIEEEASFYSFLLYHLTK